MGATTAQMLEELGRAIELVASIDDERAREALRIVTQVGFALAAVEHGDVDDGYDPEFLNGEDSDADRVAEVIAMGAVDPYARYRPREHDRG